MSNLRFKELMDKLPNGVLILDGKNKIQYANRWLLEAMEKSSSEILYRKFDTAGLTFSNNKKDVPILEHWRDWEPEMQLAQKAILASKNNKRIEGIVSARKETSETGGPQLVMCFLDWSDSKEKSEQLADNGICREQYYHLVGKSPQMQNLYNLVEMAGTGSANVLIEGESGTGKELVASAIHSCSSRRGMPFVRINCSAISESLLESQLFGHVKGAFTGAYNDRIGTFEAADKGTVFLDDVDQISPALQAKLFKVLQERVITRVGGNREIPIDVRIITSTNKPLKQLVSGGQFNKDLFRRLKAFPVPIPPLREHKADIVLLCNHFIKKYSRRTEKTITSVSSEAMHVFMAYGWPGNVRELENAIEHAFVLCNGSEIQLSNLPENLQESVLRKIVPAEKPVSSEAVPLAEPQPHVLQASSGRLNISAQELLAEIKRHNGNKAATARALGISSVGLWKKMKKMGLA